MLPARIPRQRLLAMPFAILDLLLALAPTSVLLALAWALRRTAGAPGVELEQTAVGRPEHHGELVPAYAPADA
jgi:hypothetical protein